MTERGWASEGLSQWVLSVPGNLACSVVPTEVKYVTEALSSARESTDTPTPLTREDQLESLSSTSSKSNDPENEHQRRS